MTTLAYILLLLPLAQQPQPFDAFVQHLKLLPAEQRLVPVEKFLAESATTPVIDTGGCVHFIWFGTAKTVVLNGDLQRGWSHPDTMECISCGDSSFFYSTYTVPADTRIDYQFIVDGKYGTDPGNPRITPSGYGPHSELAMPGFVSNPILKYRPDIPHGTIDSMQLKSSDVALQPRTIKIYRPAGYESLSKLPTVYVHDGFEALRDEFFDTVLDNLIADRKIKPVIAVFIPPVQREVEYIGWRQREFTQMLCDELVPLIDRTYRTSRKSEDRAMMGISNGGHVSLATVLKRPDVFLNAAGQSSTITPQLLEILDCTVGHLSSHKPFKLYTDVGTFDLDYPGADESFLGANREFSAELTKDGIRHVFRQVNDGHEWANWRERTEDILELFFGLK